MNFKQKKNLRRHIVDIVRCLEANDVLDHLHENEIFSESDCELISSGKTRKERTRLFLDILPRRGPYAFSLFTEALTLAKYGFLKEMLTNHRTSSDSTSHQNERVSEIETKTNSNSANRRSGECFDQFFKLIKENVEPNDILDKLYQDNVLSDEDCELIKQCATRRSRCSKLIQQLSDHSPETFPTVLQNALTRKYKFILDSIKHSSKASDVESCEMNKCIRSGHSFYWSCKFCLERKTKKRSDKVRPNSSLDSLPKISDRMCAKSYSEKRRTRQGLHKTLDKLMITEINSTSAPNGKDFMSKSKGHNTKKSPAILLESGFSSTVCSRCYPMTQCIKLFNARYRYTVLHERQMVHDIAVCRKQGYKTPLEQHNHLLVAFNYLSKLINQGKYDAFETCSTLLKLEYKTDHDFTCVLEYLHSSRELFRTNCDKAKIHLANALKLVSKTSNPNYFLVELLSAQTRLYLTKRQFSKFQTTLDDAKMIIESDPTNCTGHGAGWLYLNEARYCMIRIRFINFSNSNCISVFKTLYGKARISLQKSVINFQNDVGNDGPFGFGYALCRLIILLLQCGDNGGTMNILEPPDEDVRAAKQYLKTLAASEKSMPNALKMHLHLAKCDYFYRIKNIGSALKHANLAQTLGNELEMSEYSQHAYNRMLHCRSTHHIATNSNDDLSANP